MQRKRICQCGMLLLLTGCLTVTSCTLPQRRKTAEEFDAYMDELFLDDIT